MSAKKPSKVYVSSVRLPLDLVTKMKNEASASYRTLNSLIAAVFTERYRRQTNERTKTVRS